MLYEFACPDDLLEVAGACGVKDVWVTPCFKLTPDQDHPLRQHYQVTVVVTTRLPHGIALYQREIGGDCRVKAACVDLARELSNRTHLLAYIANAIGNLNPNFVFHSGLWTVPPDVKPVKVPPRIPESKEK